MAHFAEIDNKDMVQRVIVAEQDFIDSGAVGVASNWVQTSYNTRGGVHYKPQASDDDPVQPSEDQSKSLRKNFAGVNYSYDKARDAFIAPQPYPSWLLDESTCQWNAPTPRPDDGKKYDWDEDTTSWVEVDI